VRYAIIPVLLAALVLLACNDDETKPPPAATTPTEPAGTATLAQPATATGVPGVGTFGDQYDFHSFAADMDQALRARDMQFFVNNVQYEDVACGGQGFPALPPGCAGLPVGATSPGIIMFSLGSEGFYLDPAGYGKLIEGFLGKNVAPEAGDAYGDGEPRVYAYAVISAEFPTGPQAVETAQAIITAIASGAQADGTPARQTVMLGVGYDGKRWRITHLTRGFSTGLLDPFSAEGREFLGPEFFAFWQRWERSTP